MTSNLHAIMQGLTTIKAGLQSMTEGVQQIIAAFTGYLLLETGDFLLLEDGGKIELE